MNPANGSAKQDGPTAHGYRQPIVERKPTGGVIVVDARFMALAFFLYIFTPSIALDDAPPAPGAWGERAFSVAPGRHRVHVYVPYFFPPRLGPADVAVDVQPGQIVRLEYRAPLVSWVKGSLGQPPQRYRGAGWLGLILSAPLLLALCALGLSLLVPDQR